MALYSRKDFADMCGLSPGNLSNYIQRGKVIMSGDFIDEGVERNYEFYRKRIARKQGEVAEDSHKPSEKITKGEYKTPIEPKPKQVKAIKTIINSDSEEIYSLEKRKKTLDIEREREVIALLQLKKEKQMGVVIPTDLVKLIFTQHSKSIVTSFRDAADTLLIKISKKKGLDRNEVAELRGHLIDVINHAVESSIKESKRAIANIVSEYSDKKGVGERE